MSDKMILQSLPVLLFILEQVRSQSITKLIQSTSKSDMQNLTGIKILQQRRQNIVRQAGYIGQAIQPGGNVIAGPIHRILFAG